MIHKSDKVMKLLIIEPDSPDLRYSLNRVFDPGNDHLNLDQPAGVRYQIIRCRSLDNAFQIFKRKHPDVVIINLSQAGVRSFELCQLIREHEEQRHTGVIFYQGNSVHSQLLPVQCLEAGGDDYIENKASDREIIARVNTLYRFKIMTDELRSANHRLKILSLTDELTGLHNMRSFNMEYGKVLKSCQQGQTGFGVIMLDLDRFKQINDRTNHLVGSYVIGEVGRLLSQAEVLNSQVIAARYGGDEYILAVPAQSADEVWQIAEHLRDLIIRTVFEKDDYSLTVTTSIGLSWVEPGFDGKSDDPIKAADVMLYRSKNNGRNQINGMVLRYPVDFDHIGRSHLIDRDTGCDDNNIARIYNI
ncbi:MAG: diguanylate cyclase [Oligoflexus sp.]